jgi:hypothetical protein
MRLSILGSARLAGVETRAAMLTDDLLAQILHTNLEISPASGALLHEISAAWHIGISYYRASSETCLQQGVQYKALAARNQ